MAAGNMAGKGNDLERGDIQEGTPGLRYKLASLQTYNWLAVKTAN
ncbi:MAG: hypothetical protein NVSMB39_3730 [Candidatus Saccharimonadales bacterium]